MSFKTTVEHDITAIKAAFHNLPAELQSVSSGAVKVTAAIEKGLQSGTAITVASIIDVAFPNVHAEAARELAIGAIEAVLPDLQKVAVGGDVQKGALLLLAAKVAQAYHDKKISLSDYIHACQTAYDHAKVA